MLRRAACLLTLLIAALPAMAQPAANNNGRQPRILLLVDASSSMLQPWGSNATRFQTAAGIIGSLMDSIYAVNPDVEFGLRVYGHQSPAQNNDCFDSRQEVMFSKNNYTQMGLRLASLKPFGVSPIAYSLREAAANDLVDEARNAYSIILITDGGESCGGNICDVAKMLLERKIYFKPYIISLVDYAPLRDQYSCLGAFLQAAKPGDIPVAIRTIVDAYRPQLSAPIPVLKTEPPVVVQPKRDTPAVITIPAWIPEHTSLPDLRIAVPRTTMSTAVSRPRVLPVRVPGLQPVSKPEPLPVPVPVQARTNVRIDALSISRPRRPFEIGRYRPLLYTMALPRSAPVTKPDPVPLKQESIGAMVANASHYLLERNDRRYVVKPRRDALTVRVTKPDWEKPAQEDLATLSPSPVKRPLATRGMKELAPAARAVVLAAVKPSPPEPKRDTVIAVRPPVVTPPLAVSKPDTATRTSVTIKKLAPPPASTQPARPRVPVSADKPKETTFTKEVEDAKETSLSILFTDGRGKFYASTPQLQLLDATTGKQVKQFYRTVDAAGNPDPQVVPPGTYNLLVAGRANMLMRRVTVEANKKNKVIVRVNNGSLRFRYLGDNDLPTNDRAVTEFEAIVNIRFEPGPTIRQRCTSELEYVPGNYYIEVNTMPITRYNVDIDFGAITEIDLPQPGYVQFTNTSPKGQVALFAPLGNKFVRFVNLNVTGNPGSQKLQLKPGAYEAHWVKTPNMPYASETIEKFNVQSNAVTEVELR